MSAASPAIKVEVERTPADVRLTLDHLYFRRKLFQAVAKGAAVTACALAALCLISLIDNKWPLTRSTRTALLSLILISALTLVAHAVWVLLRRRSLVDAAREIERAAGSSKNSLVTFAENFENAATVKIHSTSAF